MLQLALVLAEALLKAQAEREQAAADDQRATEIINAVRLAIEQSTQRILDFLRQQRLDELAGRVDGLFATFIRYAGDPLANENRLVNLIDALALLIGEMERILDRLETDETNALNVYPIYASAVALCVFAITERRYRFRINEVFAGLLEQAKRISLRFLAILRRRSDLRIRFAAQTEEPGSVFLGYKIDGRFELVAIIPSGGTSPKVYKHVHEVIASVKDREFPKYPGVNELLGFMVSLDGAIGIQMVLALTGPLPLGFKSVVESSSVNDRKTFKFAENNDQGV